jgi:hypothetical protein
VGSFDKADVARLVIDILTHAIIQRQRVIYIPHVGGGRRRSQRSNLGSKRGWRLGSLGGNITLPSAVALIPGSFGRPMWIIDIHLIVGIRYALR